MIREILIDFLVKINVTPDQFIKIINFWQNLDPYDAIIIKNLLESKEEKAKIARESW